MSPIQESRETHEAVFKLFDQISCLVADVGRLRSKPLMGGSFHTSGFCLSSVSTEEMGLHSVRYFVIETHSQTVVSFGATKADALALARRLLTGCDPLLLAAYFGRRRAELDRQQAEHVKRVNDEQAEEFNRRRVAKDKVKSISRRRKRIFDESDGKCHYCATPLTLDGKWHVEHKMPRALGGGDEPGNLVASCAPCNNEKRDTTDVEFKAKRAKQLAAS